MKAKEVSLIVLVGYGLCLNLVLPLLTVGLNRLWRRNTDIFKRFRSKNLRDSEWYPDSTRYVHAPDLEIEAVHAGNDVLARYAREHIDSVNAEFRIQEHFVLIGILLLLEVIVAGSSTNQLANVLSYGLQKTASVVVLIIGLASLLEGARAPSICVLYLRRPDQKAL